jgi:uncharacterized protein Smg (DUF494 family)
MQERLVEILVYVLNEVRATNKQIAEIDTSALEKQGYSQNEISLALSWLFDRLNTELEQVSPSSVQPSTSFRVLHSMEKHAITPEAFGYLIQLRELRIINDAQLEMIIERAWLNDFVRLDVAGIQSIAASIVFSIESSPVKRGDVIFPADDTIH